MRTHYLWPISVKCENAEIKQFYIQTQVTPISPSGLKVYQ